MSDERTVAELLDNIMGTARDNLVQCGCAVPVVLITRQGQCIRRMGFEHSALLIDDATGDVVGRVVRETGADAYFVVCEVTVYEPAGKTTIGPDGQVLVRVVDGPEEDAVAVQVRLDGRGCHVRVLPYSQQGGQVRFGELLDRLEPLYATGVFRDLFADGD